MNEEAQKIMFDLLKKDANGIDSAAGLECSIFFLNSGSLSGNYHRVRNYLHSGMA